MIHLNCFFSFGKFIQQIMLSNDPDENIFDQTIVRIDNISSAKFVRNAN